MKFWTISVSSALIGTMFLAAGCSQRQPVTMAPPTYNPAPNYGGQNAPAGQNNVYSWTDVPVGQQVPVVRAVFDQGGYQLFAQSGETIVVPFANQNMYVMKFGQTGNGMYFVNDGQTPTLYVPAGGSLENASAQGARWYPFPQNYNYTQPVYVGLAPSWNQFVNMGWYPGMNYYGGYWGAHPYGIGSFTPMVGLYFNIGGRPYYGWNSYNNYYRSNPNYVRVRTVYNYTSYGSGRSRSYGSSYGSSGSSFGRSSSGRNNSFGSSASGSTGSFGSGRRNNFGTSSFGRSSGSGSFGSGTTTTRPFGSSSGSSFGNSSFGSGRSTSGSFGSGSSGYNSSSRRGSGSFGSGSSGYRSSGSSSGSSFGGRRSSGGSFGGGRSSSSFGGRRH